MFYTKDKIKGSLIRSDKHVIIGDHKAWNGSISSIIQEIGFLASQDTKQQRPPDGNALAARPHVGDTLLLHRLHLRVRASLVPGLWFLKGWGISNNTFGSINTIYWPIGLISFFGCPQIKTGLNTPWGSSHYSGLLHRKVISSPWCVFICKLLRTTLDVCVRVCVCVWGCTVCVRAPQSPAVPQKHRFKNKNKMTADSKGLNAIIFILCCRKNRLRLQWALHRRSYILH